ncbi:MAG: DUF2339 domain-containing protein [Saprospiraceae bacterium]|uniref:DUF2339 domain-containing protein n=1 Tax=Candidatus Opimibacter skivensis TaxID=2982028 RepID=A0A9D7SZR7_9BACT|nr:DUF2339 domain-containing protein [Candidatus Opimibacter skivensis]
MSENAPHINELLEKLDVLLKRQDDFSREIHELRTQIIRLKTADEPKEETTQPAIEETYVTPISEQRKINVPPPIPFSNEVKPIVEEQLIPSSQTNTSPDKKSDLEKFIGENLINKIGIAITVIGVAIGAKYSIDHDLISPLTRIILGYMMGLGLMGTGMKLRKNYENFSAVLESGAIAIMYFITYAAYSFYGLMPMVAAFVLMVVFTVFTVVTAIKYNSQVIAIIGLVGAYAVPFLLSEGSGNAEVLFSYMAIINIGILFIAIKKYWKILYYSSFILTWIIFTGWVFTDYEPSLHFSLAFIFLAIFFFTFYFIFLAYKLIKKEKFEFGDIVVLLGNSFIFYGIGYYMLNDSQDNSRLLGLFTLCTAVIHFIVAVLIYRQRLADRNLFFLVAGLFLIFITIAIPVQLDGNWVTLLWTGEAALLFWIGRTNDVPMYERLSFPLMALAFLSLLSDWTSLYDVYQSNIITTTVTPFININFLTSVLFIGAFFFITQINSDEKYKTEIYPSKQLGKMLDFVLPTLLLVVLYFSIRMEISFYFQQMYSASVKEITSPGDDYSHNIWNDDLNNFRITWIINYSLLFFSVLFYLKRKMFSNITVRWILLSLGIIVLFSFLTLGLYILSELRENYLDQTLSEYYQHSSFNIVIRYITLVFAGLFLFSLHRFITTFSESPSYTKLKIFYELILSMAIIWIATSELLSWMDIMKSTQSYKLVLSILWGLCSLILVILGIWKDKKHLRIAAILLFAATLLKLFFYDILELSTISKTIVFVVLGILLLIISFLYNKYTHKIK